jgi:hypothetical protein
MSIILLLNLIFFQTGGRDTAGMGGRGGYKRLYKGGDIKQVRWRNDVSEQIPDVNLGLRRTEERCA